MSGMRPILPDQWPPLITSTRQPAWMPWRDRLLTLAMWLLLALLCRNSIALAADLAREAAGIDRRRPHPDFALFWARLEPYLVVTALLLMWIVTFGTLALRRLRRRWRHAAPELPITEEAAARGATPDALEDWRTARVAVVHVEGPGVMRVEAKGA